MSWPLIRSSPNSKRYVPYTRTNQLLLYTDLIRDAGREGGRADERLSLLASNRRDQHRNAVEMKTLGGRLNLSEGLNRLLASPLYPDCEICCRIYPIHDLVQKGVSLDLLRRQIEGHPDSVHIMAKVLALGFLDYTRMPKYEY